MTLDSPSSAIAACGGFCYAYTIIFVQFFYKVMRTEDKKPIHFFATPDEKKLLEDYAIANGKTKTTVLRELVLSLRAKHSGRKSSVVRTEYRGFGISMELSDEFNQWMVDVCFPNSDSILQQFWHKDFSDAVALAHDIIDAARPLHTS